MVFQERKRERGREEEEKEEEEEKFASESFVRCSRVILLRGGCLSDRNSDIKTQYRTGRKKVGGDVGGGGWLRSTVMTVLERTCMGIRYIHRWSNIPRGRKTLFSVGWMGQE